MVEIDTLPSQMYPRSIDDVIESGRYHKTGWPMLAMTCSTHVIPLSISPGSYSFTVRGGLYIGKQKERNHRALPLTPVLPGFLIDTLFYAVIWLGITLGFGLCFGTWRARRRLRLGRCAHCSYPRDGLDPASVCPECGTVWKPGQDAKGDQSA